MSHEVSPLPKSRRLSAIAIAATIGVATAIGGSLIAMAQTPPATPPVTYPEDQVRLGYTVWKDKVWCGQCHGWSGNGLPDDPRSPVGANLREIVRTPEQIATAIRCGIPGTEMPAFDALAYTDTRCYNATREQLGAMTPPNHGITLIRREVDAVVAYLFTTVIGRGPFTDEDCRNYFGATATLCDTIRAGGTPAPAGAPAAPAAPGVMP